MPVGDRVIGKDTRITLVIDGVPTVVLCATTQDFTVNIGTADASSFCNSGFITTISTTRSITGNFTTRVTAGQEFVADVMVYLEENSYIIPMIIEAPQGLEFRLDALVTSAAFPGTAANDPQDFNFAFQDQDGYSLKRGGVDVIQG